MRTHRIHRLDLACCAGIVVIALASTGCTRAAHASVPEEPAPSFQQRGDELIVPEGSPLRDRLAVAAVSPQRVRHELDVPANRTRTSP